MAVDPSALTSALLTPTHRTGKSLSIHKHTVFKVAVWTSGAALSRWGVGVGAVERRTRSSLTLNAAMLTGADLAGLVRGCEPLAVGIDPMVVSAAFTLGTTGASSLGGMLAGGGGAASL